MDYAEFCSVLSASVIFLSPLAVPEVFLRDKSNSLAPSVSILGMHNLLVHMTRRHSRDWRQTETRYARSYLDLTKHQ